jgi:hypothetical protein
MPATPLRVAVRECLLVFTFRMRCGWVPLGLFATILGLLVPAAARANIGPQWWGELGAEPRGVKGVAITREKLTIDLRPVASLRPVEVEAVYYLDNGGAAKKLDLVFVSGVPELSDFEIVLDDRPTIGRLVPVLEDSASREEIPPSWKPPRLLPGIGRDGVYTMFRSQMRRPAFLAFKVELPRGASTLRVRCRARAAGADEGYPTATWEFPYILAPARDWDGFGRLDVTAYLPAGWQWTSRPALESDGSVLRGSFEGLPADCLVVAVRKPLGSELEDMETLAGGLYLVSIAFGGVLCWWFGRCGGCLLGAKAAKGWWGAFRVACLKWLLAAVCAVAWSAATLEGRVVVMNRIYNCLEGQESPYFHERFALPNMGIFLLVILLLPIGVALALAGAARGQRRGAGREMPVSQRMIE